MTLEDILSRLDHVRQHGDRFSARCPAHADRSPSLSVREGDEGRILLHCFSGCRAAEIVAALGLTVADLFDDPRPDHGPRGRALPPRRPRVDRDARSFQFELGALDLRLRAERTLRRYGRRNTLGDLTDDELDARLAQVAAAYTDIQRAELLESVADRLRERKDAQA